MRLGWGFDKKLFEHFVLVKNVQLDKNMAGGARGRGCSDRIFDFQSSNRRIHDLDLGASNI